MDIFVDVGGFGPGALARPHNSLIKDFLANVWWFLESQHFEIRTFFAAAYAGSGLTSISEDIRRSVNDMFGARKFAGQKLRVAWGSTATDHVIQERIEQAARAGTLSHDVMIVTMNPHLAPVIEDLKRRKFSVTICGKSLTSELRRHADRVLYIKDIKRPAEPVPAPGAVLAKSRRPKAS